jgi:hypothetical protein
MEATQKMVRLGRNSGRRWLLAFLLAAVSVAGAQHSPHAGGSGGGEGGGGGRPKETGDPEAMADFSRMMAVQANDAQQEKFPDLAHEATVALQAAQQLAQNISDKSGVQNVRTSVQHLREDSRAFLRDLTKPQRSGLKPVLQKLSKSESEMEKATSGLGDNPAPAAAQAVVTAVQKYQDDLKALGDQMGVKPQTQPQ